MESISSDGGGHKLAELEMKRRKKKKDKRSSSSRKSLKPRVGMDGARAGKLKSLSRNSGTLVPRSKKELREYSKMRKSTDNLMAGFDFETTSSGKFKTFASHSNLDQKIGSPKKKSPRPESSPSMEDIPKPTKTLAAVPPLRMPRPPTSKPEPSKSPEASTRKRPLTVEIDENEELRLDKLRNSPFHRKSKNQSPDAMRRSKLDLLEQSQNLILPSALTGEDEEEVIVEKKKRRKRKKKKKLNLDSTTDKTRDSLDDLFKSDLDEDLEEDVDIDDLFNDLTPKTKAKKEVVKKKREKLTLDDTKTKKFTTRSRREKEKSHHEEIRSSIRTDRKNELNF